MQQVQFISITPGELIDVFSDRMKLILQEELQNIQSKNSKQEEKKFLTRAEACDFLGLTYGGLHKWVREGRITTHKVSNKPYYLRAELDQLILKNNLK